MTNRQQYTGRLCVYRESSMQEYLSAKVTMTNGTEFHYYRCPKCFDDLITDPLRNVAQVTFVAGPDGVNPRGARIAGN